MEESQIKGNIFPNGLSFAGIGLLSRPFEVKLSESEK